MKRREFLQMAGALPAVMKAATDDAQVQRVLDRAIVIDLHCDTIQVVVDEGYQLAELHTYSQVDTPRMRRGHVSGIFLASCPNSRVLSPVESIRRALIEVDAIQEEVARGRADLVTATTADEIVAAKKNGKIACLACLEGGHIIDSDLAVLRSFYRLGARYMTLTHFTPTPWADSSSRPPLHNGLTDFGRQVVQEMNRLGMMVDISHVSDKTFWDTLETSRAPIIASHSSCRALANHPRNMTDDMIRALGKNGGVIHINYANEYLDQNFLERFNFDAYKAEGDEVDRKFAADPRRRMQEHRRLNAIRLAKFGRVPFSRLIDTFEHAAKLAGVDHVGLGSDFDGVSDELPTGMEDISKIPNLVRGLLDRGFSDGDVEKILGGNTLRVMRQVEKVARS